MSRKPSETPIMQHTSAIIKGLAAEAESLRKLNHKPLKGQLRELFITRLLSKFLTIQYGVGSGVIINQLGDQSPQTDIIIYDRRILPPFIEEQKIGLYPAECVLATIEIKSKITNQIIQEYAKTAKVIHEKIYDPLCSHYRDYDKLRPFCTIFGFNGNSVCKGMNEDQIYDWMDKNAKPLFGVCVLNKFSWLHVCRNKGALRYADENNEETKAFLAPLLDNIRTKSQQRYSKYMLNHIDWLGIYTRRQSWTDGEF
ncbi:MAG: hypothetical protein NWE96_07040 [Candidatus Bathyarchaeota archaeon]|nr:hypothetical protein [Candidatus Bathyarchaeota archaeon]